jgi:hypothetical protein
MRKIQPTKKTFVTAAAAAIVAVGAPVLLVAGAAQAQAQTNIDTTTNPFGVTVFIESVGPGKSSGWCTYVAEPNGPGVPVRGLPFYLQEGKPTQLWFPGIKTGITWDVAVGCQNGTNSGPTQVVY